MTSVTKIIVIIVQNPGKSSRVHVLIKHQFNACLESGSETFSEEGCQHPTLVSEQFGHSKVDLLGEGTEGVAEGLGGQVEQCLQKHLSFQRVEALTLVQTNHHGREREKKTQKSVNRRTNGPLTIICCFSNRCFALWMGDRKKIGPETSKTHDILLE